MENESEGKRILLITKPLVPPWHDSGKNIPRDLVQFSKRYQYTVFVTKGAALWSERIVAEDIYPDAGHFSPSTANQVRLLFRLLKPDRRSALYHFFFTPNPKTSLIGKQVMRLKRRLKSLQTVTSEPVTYEGIGRLIFADAVVVCSDNTQRRLQPYLRCPVHRIYPGIDPEGGLDPDVRKRERSVRNFGDRFVLVYPGDFAFSKSIDTLREAATVLLSEDDELCLVLACRAKTAADREAEASLRQALSPFGDAVRFVGEVEDMAALLSAADGVIFPVASLYGKMDIPLVLLEAMALERPLIVSDLPPLRELAADEPGILIPPADPKGLVQAVRVLKSDPERRRRWGSNGRRSVVNRFSAEAMAEAYETLYSRMIK